MVSAAIREHRQAIEIAQLLAPGGKMIAPVVDDSYETERRFSFLPPNISVPERRDSTRLYLYTRKGDQLFEQLVLISVSFVSLQSPH